MHIFDCSTETKTATQVEDGDDMRTTSYKPSTRWKQKADDWDSWNITLLPHHLPIRSGSTSWSHILHPSPLLLPFKTLTWKPLGSSGLLGTSCLFSSLGAVLYHNTVSLNWPCCGFRQILSATESSFRTSLPWGKRRWFCPGVPWDQMPSPRHSQLELQNLVCNSICTYVWTGKISESGCNCCLTRLKKRKKWQLGEMKSWDQRALVQPLFSHETPKARKERYLSKVTVYISR